MSKQKFCKFCRSYDVDGLDQTFSEKDILKHEFKLFGEEFEMCNYIENGELRLYFLGRSGGGRNLAKRKINFCPMCGRSLKTACSEK